MCRDFDIKIGTESSISAVVKYVYRQNKRLEQRVKEHQDACKRVDEKV